SRSWLGRELRIVEPKLLVVMGDDALAFLNELGFPLSRPLEEGEELQRFTPTIEALVVPDIDSSLDDQAAKTTFWNAFKTVGSWWAALPPTSPLRAPLRLRRGGAAPLARGRVVGRRLARA